MVKIEQSPECECSMDCSSIFLFIRSVIQGAMHYESLQICLKVLIHLPFTFFVDEVETRGLQSSVKSISPQYLSLLSINEILQIIPKYHAFQESIFINTQGPARESMDERFRG